MSRALLEVDDRIVVVRFPKGTDRVLPRLEFDASPHSAGWPLVAGLTVPAPPSLTHPCAHAYDEPHHEAPGEHAHEAALQHRHGRCAAALKELCCAAKECLHDPKGDSEGDEKPEDALNELPHMPCPESIVVAVQERVK
jgi:hypothetical protein